MKKFYTNTIKSVALMAFAFMANVAAGQNLMVTANGNPVKDGDIVEVTADVEDYSEIMGSLWTFYTWDPQLNVSLASGKSTVKFTLTKMEDYTPFEICWPMQCIEYNESGIATTSGEVGTTPSYVSIHIMKEVTEQDPDVSLDGGMNKVLIQCGSESLEFTLKGLPFEDTGVEENFAASNLPAVYYNMEGIQIEKPTAKGMYIVRKGNKSKVMMIK